MKQDTKYRLRDSEGKEYIIIDSEKVDMQEELNKTITKQMKEIERLKNINEEHRILNGKLRVENSRSNNIINELEEYLNKVIETSSEQERITCSFVLQYLQELKGKINNV